MNHIDLYASHLENDDLELVWKIQLTGVRPKNKEVQLKIIPAVWCLGSTLLGVVAHALNVLLSSINPFSYLPAAPCDVAGLFPGSRVSCVGWMFEAAEMRKTPKHTLAERERNPQGRLPFLQHHDEWPPLASVSTCLPAQLMLPWRTKRLFPSVSRLDAFTHFPPAVQSLFISRSFTEDLLSSAYCLATHSTSRSLHPLTKRASSAWRLLCHSNRFDVSGHISVCFFCLQEVWIRAILVFLVHEWWLLTEGSFGDQRLKT